MQYAQNWGKHLRELELDIVQTKPVIQYKVQNDGKFQKHHVDMVADEAQTYGADFRIMSRDEKNDYLDGLLLNETIDNLNAQLAKKDNTERLTSL